MDLNPDAPVSEFNSDEPLAHQYKYTLPPAQWLEATAFCQKLVGEDPSGLKATCRKVR
jgi:hypothetical protein